MASSKFYFPVFAIFLLLLSCQMSDRSDHVTSHDNFDWIIGSWQRTNNDEGQITHEHWKKISSLQYKGLGCTMEAGDTVFKELLSIEQIDGDWNLIVSGVNEQATNFILSEQSKEGFVAVNEHNEFPKKIEYSLENETLNAMISAADIEIPFHFRRMMSN